MGVNGGPNLQDIFNQRFGAGAYENGINQARQAGQNYYNAQVQAAAQKLFEQQQAAQDKIQKQQQAAQAKLQQPIDDQKNASDYWNQNKDALLQKGAYQTVQDLQNDPELQAQLKAKGYDIKALADQAYNVATGGKIKSAAGFKDFYDSVNPDSTTRKQNQSEIQDVIDKDAAQAAQAKQDAINKANYDNSWYGKLLNGIGSGLNDTGNVIGSAVSDVGKSIGNEYSKVVNDPQGIGHGLYGAGNDFFTSLSELGNRVDNQATGTLLGQGAVDKEHQQQQNLLNQLKLNPNTAPLAQSNQNIFNQSNSPAKSGLDQLANLTGGFAGNVAPYLVGDGLLGAASKIGKVGELGNLISNPLTKRVAGGALSGAVGGSLVSGARAVGGDNQNANDVMKNILDNAAFGAGGEFLLGGGPKSILSNLNLKGQAAKLMQDTGSVKFNPDTFQQAVQDAHAPKGDFSNVVADTTQQMPKPFEQKYNLSQPTKVTPTAEPTVQPGSNTNNWFGTTAQEQVPQPNVPSQPILPHALADNAFTKATLQANAPAEGFNQRLLDVQKEMKGLQNNAQSIANQHGGSYTPNVDSLYQQVRKANDPNTFDDLVKNAEMEHNVANPDLKTALHLDPRIKQQLDALNALGKPAKQTSKLIPEIAPKNKGLTVPEVKGTHQSPHDLLKALQTDRNVKPGGNGGSGLLMGLTPKKLDSIKITKAIETMSKGELQDVMTKLEKQESLVSKGGKGSEAQLKKIQSDKQKVSDLLMKLDLQQHAANPFEAVKERILGKAPEKTPQDTAKEKAQFHSAVNKLEEKGSPLSGKTIQELQTMKDIKPWQKQTLSSYDLFKKLPSEIGNRLTKLFDKAKSGRVEHFMNGREDIYNKVVQGLGIKKGSKESALVQDYGEKTLGKKALEAQGRDLSTVSKEELNKVNEAELNRLAGDKADKYRAADKYARDFYHQEVNKVNTEKAKIYPNQPDKLVPIREDYYHHFNELHGFDNFKNVLERNHGIDPHLAGLSHDTKPKTKWAAPWQKRGNGEYKSDAVGGMLRYLQASSYATHIDPFIKELRDTADHMATTREGIPSENHAKAALNMRADELAGKTHEWDRAIQSVMGRKAWNVLNTVNSQIKKNKIIGNLGSFLGVTGNVPGIVGVTKGYAAKGLPYAMKDWFSAALDHGKITGPMAESKFLKERYMNEGNNKFETNAWKKGENAASHIVEAGDKAASYLAWHSSYQQALGKGLKGNAAVDFADKQAMHLIGGRGVGERPLFQTSKMTHIIAPFTLEVTQLSKVLSKQLKTGDIGGLATFLVGAAFYNHFIQTIRGSGASYDPLGAGIEGWNNKNNMTTGDKVHGALSNAFGDTFGQIPGATNIMKMAGLDQAATKKFLFGDKSPDRFGSGTGALTDYLKPLTDLTGLVNGKGYDPMKEIADLLPTLPYGSQLSKTFKGSVALARGGQYNKAGNLEYPVNGSNPADLMRVLMFGPSATSTGQTYNNEHGSALSPKDTQAVQSGLKNYDSIMQQRAQNAIKTQINKVRNDKTLDPNQRIQKIAILMQKMQQGK